MFDFRQHLEIFLCLTLCVATLMILLKSFANIENTAAQTLCNTFARMQQFGAMMLSRLACKQDFCTTYG